MFIYNIFVVMLVAGIILGYFWRKYEIYKVEDDEK